MTKKRLTASSGCAAKKVAGVSSAAVVEKTGKSWDQWIALLDRRKADTMEHKSIARLLHEKYGLSGWWSQMITVGYEQSRMGRKQHQTDSGFQVSASRTIDVPLEALYQAWSQKRRRRAWLPECEFAVRKSTPNKSMRITWVDGQSHVDAYFNGKSSGKSQVVVQHKKLKSEAAAERTKVQWRERLLVLKRHLETK